MAATALDACLLALLGVVTVSDLRHRLVPDRALIVASIAGLALLVAADPSGLSDRVAAAAAAGAFLLAAALVRPEGMGLGDVKLAAVLGLYLGWRVGAALLFAFAAGAVAGLAIVVRHGWVARSRTIPFAPFLAFGALLAMAAQP